MNEIIINTDDFGISKGVNLAVIEGHKHGMINSTTALVKSQEILHAAELAESYPNLKIGLHFTIDFGKSLSLNRELCTENGMFYPHGARSNLRRINKNILVEEWELQVEEFVKVFNKLPDHFDSHHNVHINNSDVKEVAKQMSIKYNIPVRGMNVNNTNSLVNTDFYGNDATIDNLINIIEEYKKCKATNKEIMIHNGYLDCELNEITTYNAERMSEHQVIMSDKIQKYVNDNDISIVSFKIEEYNA